MTITMVGNNYVINFGEDPNDWLQLSDVVTFDFTADITDGTPPGTLITNTTEVSDYDNDNNSTTAPPNDIDSIADDINGN